MARARNIKPGFFKNENLAECSPWARLCFAGLWTIADREGRLEDRPKRIKGELFAFDTIDVEPLLAELEHWGFITRYAVNGTALIQIDAFEKHQNPHHRELPSELPSPSSPGLDPLGNPHKPGAPALSDAPDAPGKPEAFAEEGDLASGSSRADPGFLIPDSGEESCGSAKRPRLPTPDFDGSNAEALNGKAVAAIATGFELPESWGLDAVALGWKPHEVLRMGEEFRQYWTAGRGAGTRRGVKGWRQSWSTWLSKAAKDRR